MKTLVTGGTGFIGSHLIERLTERGDEVTCIAKDRLNVTALETLGIRMVLGDLNNGIAWDRVLDGVDCIYHLAGVTRARSYEEYYQGNHLATKRLMEICRNNSRGIKRIVYLSSLAAVGPSPDGLPLDESAPMHPVSDYGESKKRGEMEVRKAQDILPITIIRPSAVYGPREVNMLEYMRLIKRGIHPLIGFRKKYLSLVHVSDLVDGLISAATSPEAIGQTYFLASEESYTNEDIGEAIGRAVSVRPIPLRVPHSLVYAIGAIGTCVAKTSGNQVFLNLQKARECVQRAWVCSVAKAKKDLGYRQSVSLGDGMASTYAWYRQNGWM